MAYLKERYDEMTFHELSEDMDIEEIIYAVEETINTANVDFNTNFESIKIAFDNARYYIKDDYTQYYFNKRCRELCDAAKDIVKEDSLDGVDFVWWNKNIVELIHQVFDEEYFVNQMVHLRRSKTSGCKSKLQSLLHKFNEKQLKEYYQLISYGVERFCWFASDDVWDEMLDHLSYQLCFLSGNDNLFNDLEDGSPSLRFFNYISRERFIEILLIAIEYHTFIAEKTAEKLYNWGYDEAFMYLKGEGACCDTKLKEVGE